MKMIAQAVSASILFRLAGSSAYALPIAPPASLGAPADIVRVADGCGPFGHRSHFGYCKPNGYAYGYPYGYGAPGYYGPRPFYGRRCVIRETYYGPRRVCY